MNKCLSFFSALIFLLIPQLVLGYAEASYYAQGYYEGGYSADSSYPTHIDCTVSASWYQTLGVTLANGSHRTYDVGAGGWFQRSFDFVYPSAPASLQAYHWGTQPNLVMVTGQSDTMISIGSEDSYDMDFNDLMCTATWTNPVPPTPASCSVTLTPSAVNSGANATLSWSSSNADTWTYIANVGYLSGSGSSFTVSRSATTDYSCYAQGSGGSNGWHAYTLTVTPPAAPTASITSSLGSTIQVGQSSTITATFTSTSGDAITHDNIDSPLGTGVGPDTNPGTKTYTFTPSTAGTYTFYARAQTSYYSSWTTYNSITVTVQAPCTLNGTTLQSGDSATFYTQQVAPTGQLCSAVSQSRTCTNGVLSGSASYQYSSCTCAPLYSCSGNNVTYTNASCSTATTAVCTAPNYCSPGITTCVSPVPVFNASSNTTGHLQVKPQIVPLSGTATVLWNVSNVSGCTVTGSNGQTWSTLSGANTTLPISQQTTFTLACTPYSGQTFTPETQRVNVVPRFQEQ